MPAVSRYLRWSLAGVLGLVIGAGATGAILIKRAPADAAQFRPRTVVVKPGSFRHRIDGEFTRAGQPVDAPLVDLKIAAPLEIMAYQVSTGDHARCVADGGCKRLDVNLSGKDLPVTGVSHADAADYARWLSAKTGETWRLPDDHEWAYAAGSRFKDDASGLENDASNPARRWLADYDRETARKDGRDATPRPHGAFGVNEHGLHDLAGNVWEWTRTCQRRAELDDKGKVAKESTICGVYVVEGQHRAMMTFFIRNPKNGGCSVGVPPDNLGFRLVRDLRWHERVTAGLRGIARA